MSNFELIASKLIKEKTNLSLNLRVRLVVSKTYSRIISVNDFFLLHFS